MSYTNSRFRKKGRIMVDRPMAASAVAFERVASRVRSPLLRVDRFTSAAWGV